MSQDQHRYRELTIDEITGDPIVVALMRADNVEPAAVEGLLRVAVSAFALRAEARRLREMATTVLDPASKQEFAAQALDLAQRAEIISRWQEDPASLRLSVEHYRTRLAAGIPDSRQRQTIEQILLDAEQLNAPLSNLAPHQ